MSIRYGFYRVPCEVIQVSGEGRYVKVETDRDKAIYVFTRRPDGSYKRPGPGFIVWDLQR